jgi:hypothetical protein
VLNEAFLERFAITVEQEYPPAATERKILKKNFDVLGLNDDVFIDRLITWAEVIRKSFADGAVDEVISTRRLVHISKAFSIFNNRLKAIEMCLNRFDTDTKTAFLDLYTKVDAEATAPAPESQESFSVSLASNNQDMVFTLSKNGVTESITMTSNDLDSFRGMSEEQIKDRVLDTLRKVIDRRIEQEDRPF